MPIARDQLDERALGDERVEDLLVLRKHVVAIQRPVPRLALRHVAVAECVELLEDGHRGGIWCVLVLLRRPTPFDA